MQTPAALSPTLPSDVDVAIRVRGLETGFGAQTIHKDLDLDVRRGEIIGLVGGSGTGKSVLLRCIIGLETPRAGTIEVLGRDAATLDAVEGRALRRRWGVLFQEGALFSALTVAENIEVPMREFLDLPLDLMDEFAKLKVRMVGLPEEAACKFPSELSGGMRKRAALARALALDPLVLFLDEPTAGLDPIAAAAFDDLVRVLRDTLDLTVFLITHDLDTLHATCDRVAVLSDGLVIACGTIEALREFDHPWVQEYFSGPRGRAAVRSQRKPPAQPTPQPSKTEFA
ncbi:ABC transporter ATP-binding protein [Polymorphobacter multimanifer]|uniref:Phospholipid/cholesterol/gamma-HCH transport system ATP-binding protein n=1 Tax=Polymorphobacter multimanifer TaxID=1070431 RepID=A0A841L607_9SPHN|nr:ATP-binding cassette domain-containing protein [Polymorphobacter multimanifer]MBB6227686.1 phospholipid/cholesterol/gamma-HCH transport system ATP-binding protein [Polymorphobacter multimanifer]GGI70890.1 ABC transporter ATP-binding protein [Polymorphobacter multimanifer]